MGNINFELPDDLHKEFKLYSVEQGIDMKELLVQQVRTLVGKRHWYYRKKGREKAEQEA